MRNVFIALAMVILTSCVTLDTPLGKVELGMTHLQPGEPGVPAQPAQPPAGGQQVATQQPMQPQPTAQPTATLVPPPPTSTPVGPDSPVCLQADWFSVTKTETGPVLTFAGSEGAITTLNWGGEGTIQRFNYLPVGQVITVPVRSMTNVWISVQRTDGSTSESQHWDIPARCSEPLPVQVAVTWGSVQDLSLIPKDGWAYIRTDADSEPKNMGPYRVFRDENGVHIMDAHPRSPEWELLLTPTSQSGVWSVSTLAIQPDGTKVEAYARVVSESFWYVIYVPSSNGTGVHSVLWQIEPKYTDISQGGEVQYIRFVSR